MNREEIAAWGNSLQVGNEVILCQSWGGQNVVNIQAVTPAQVVINGTSFWKKNGKQVGGTLRHGSCIVPATDERKQSLIDEKRRQEAESKFRNLSSSPRGYSVEQLEAVIAILEPKKEQPNDNGRNEGVG